MEQQQVDNKRIAKNTIVLYLRSLLTLAISLYTSRIILSALGVDDYGIYNIVGGIVYMFAFLNSSLSAASSRFIAYELGRGNKDVLKDMFSTVLTIHFLLAIVILLLSETIGLWFVNFKLNIPPDRMFAANWVFQFTLATFFLNIMCVPYNAVINAHEHMSAFAYLSILDVVFKLIIVLILPTSPIDKLIMYGMLVMAVQLIMRIIYNVYCTRHFEEARWRLLFRKDLFKNIFSYVTWSFLGNMGASLRQQVNNILINLYHGVAVNAACGIAGRVSGIVSSFAGSFNASMNPQIIKTYASGNYQGSSHLVYRGSRFSFFLFMIIAIPTLINIDYVLDLWLEEVPVFASQFIFFIILFNLINTMAFPVVNALQATGRIMVFQVGNLIIQTLGIPFSYLVLRWGYDPYYVEVPVICSCVVALFFRLYVLKGMVSVYSIRKFFFSVFSRCFIIFTFCLIVCYYIRSFFEDSFLTLIITSIISVVICGVAVAFLGMTKHERVVITTKAISMIKSRLHIG